MTIEWRKHSAVVLSVLFPALLFLVLFIPRAPNWIGTEVQPALDVQAVPEGSVDGVQYTDNHRTWNFIDVNVQGFVDPEVFEKPPGNRSPKEVSQGIYAKDTFFCAGPESEMTEEKRTAICLVGSTQEFQFTGPSISKWVLSRWGYPHADVFVITPLDENTHKLTALTEGRLVSVNIFSDYSVNVSQYQNQALSALNKSENFLKMLLMEERCIELIQEREAAQNFKYHWVVRTRLNGYWVWSPPSLHLFNHSAFTIPKGHASYGFINERLSVANRENTWLSLSRAQHLKDAPLHSVHPGEHLMKQVLKANNVEVAEIDFFFCTLSHHWNADVYFMGSMGPLGGLDCKPCNETIPNWSNRVKCVDQGEWEPNWMEIYESDTPPAEQEAMRHIMRRSYSECIEDLNKMMNKTIEKAVCDHEFVRPEGQWNAPSPSAICTRSLLGPRTNIGSSKNSSNGYGAFTFSLDEQSKVYSMSIGSTHGWKSDLKKHRGIEVHNLPPPGNLGQSSVTIQSKYKKIKDIKDSWEWIPIKSSQIHLLLLDIGELVDKVLESWAQNQPDPVCQLLINFSYLTSRSDWDLIVEKLAQFDFQLDSCQAEPWEFRGRCTFFSVKYCTPLLQQLPQDQ